MNNKKTVKMCWVLGLSACLALALVLVIRAVLPEQVEPPEPEDDCGSVCVQPYEPWPREEGEDRSLQFRAAPDGPELFFSIYINKEHYCAYEEDGIYMIRPRQEPEDETLPECKLDISYMADVTGSGAMQRVKANLTGQYRQVEMFPGPCWFHVTSETWFWANELEGYVFASDGTDRNDAQCVVWIIPCSEGGVFLLSASYYTEAAAGHGTQFIEMMKYFGPRQAADEEDEIPWTSWTRKMRDAGERLTEAVFANDLSGVKDLLAKNAEVDAYDEDVSNAVSIVSIEYREPPYEITGDSHNVIVSVKHRLDGEDACRFLTMELVVADEEGRRKATRITLED